MANRRTEIVDLLVTNLKNIDGGTSSYNASYTYTQNLFNNVYQNSYAVAMFSMMMMMIFIIRRGEGLEVENEDREATW